jgi:hypothetical protein
MSSMVLHDAARGASWRPWRWLRLLAVVALAALGGCAPAALRVPAHTPYYDQPSLAEPMVGYTTEALVLPVRERRWLYLGRNPFAGQRAWHPLMVCTRMHRVRLPEGREVWVTLNMQTDATGTKFRFVRTARPGVLALAGAAALALLALLAWGWRQGRWPRLWVPGEGTRSDWLLAAAVIVLLRVALLLLVVGWTGQQLIHPTDEHGYFTIAHDLLGRGGGSTWNYTLGLGLYYLPLVWLTGADGYYGVLWPLCWLTGLVAGPLLLVQVLWLLRRLSGSLRLAAAVALALAVLPFCYLPYELAGQYKSIFTWPNLHPAHFTAVYIFTATGFNGLSDTPSAVLVLGCLILATWLRPGWRYVVVIGALYGLTCLVRINHCFFAPLLAYLMWRRLAPRYRSPLQAAGYGLAAAGAALAVFAPQFVVNHLQQGHWLRFPYVRHQNRAAEGFALDIIPEGLRYLVHGNLLYAVGAAVALWFIADRHRRTVLVLWVAPLWLFFAGYPVVTASPLRWLLATYGALLGALALADPWRELPRRRAWALAAVLAADVLLHSPIHPLLEPRQWGWPAGLVGALQLGLPWLAAGAAAWCCGRRWRPLAFALTFLLLWHTAAAWAVGLSLAALTLRALVDAVRLGRAALPAPPAQRG